MPSSFNLSGPAAEAAADAVTARLNGGRLRIYAGNRPPDADSPAPGTLLGELRFSRPAFGPARDGVAVALAIIEDGNARATGTATWFRALTASNEAVFDGSVGKSGADLNLGSVAIQAGARITIERMNYRQRKS